MEYNKGSLRTWLPTIVGIIIVVLIGGTILAYQYWLTPKIETPTPIEPPTPVDTEQQISSLIEKFEFYQKERDARNALMLFTPPKSDEEKKTV